MEWTRGQTIGLGSTATVSLATSAHTGDVFAAKSTELSRSEYLQREQKLLSSMSCPYIIGYKGCDITREHNMSMYNIFLEYIPGGTLSDACRSGGGCLGERDIKNYTWQILQGLDYLHSSGLVHCDIKGSNILIGPSGAKIADFGCAKRVNPDQPLSKPALTGTPMFMAPEVARGVEQGFPSDIWSLGCTIIEMATGSSPWKDLTDPVSVLYRVGYSGQTPDIPCFLSEHARDFLDKCIRRDPKERWTARQLLSHPFLMGDHQGKQLLEEPNNICTWSPTSILEQELWNSLDEQESSTFSSSMTSDPRVTLTGERLGKLMEASVEPSWDQDGDDWVTVRGVESGGRDTIMEVKEEVELETMVAGGGGGGGEELLDCSIVNKSRNIIGEFDFLGGCGYGMDSFVANGNFCSTSERDRDVLLIPSRSMILLQS